MPTKSKRSAKKARTPKPAANEPEVLGDDTHDGVREPLLDALAYVLEQSDGREAPARKVIAKAFGGTCDAAREHEVLLIVKRDARFRVIADSGRHGNRIALVSATIDPATVAGTLSIGPTGEVGIVPGALVVTGPIGIQPADPQQTLGELAEAAKGRPLVIPWPHDVGSHVLLLTDGHPARKATIRNIHATGSSAFYDLTTESGGETNDVPAYRIGRDLDAEGEIEAMRLENGALRRHIAKGATLAQQIVVKEAEERQAAEALSKLRKAIDELHDKLADHERTEPGQTDLRDVVGDGDGTPRGERMASEPSDAEDVLADGAPPNAPVSLDALGIDLDQLHAARVDRAAASTGKPAKCRPVAGIDGRQHVLTDVQDGVAVLLPIVDTGTWAGRYGDEFGTVLELPSDAQSAALAKGGILCGCPVKVGRATRWIGPERDALLVRLPVEEKAVGKDAAAGG